MRILVVEDDPVWREQVVMYLEAEGYEVYEASNGLVGYHLYMEKHPDIVVLDVAMPGADGLSLARQILMYDRATHVIFMSGLTRVEDVVKGYETGADQYFEKPFEIPKMLAYMRSLEIRPEVRFGNCTYTTATRSLSVNGHAIVLTPSLARVLHCLALHLGQPVSRKDLSVALHGHDRAESRTIDMHVSRLRRILAADSSIAIESLYGGGYRLRMKN